jgi:hypothetical protein
MVKLDADVLSMMPVAPPSAGPDRGWPLGELGDGVGVAAAVVEAEDVDGDEVAAAATPDPASTATADAIPAPRIQALLSSMRTAACVAAAYPRMRIPDLTRPESGLWSHGHSW